MNKIPFLLKIDTPDLFLLKKTQGTTLVDPLLCANLLSQHSTLKHMRIYSEASLFFIYNPSCGTYQSFPKHRLLSIVDTLLSQLSVDFASDYLNTVVSSLLCSSEHSFIGYPIYDRNYLVFKNGALNISTKQLEAHSPLFFTTRSFVFEYNVMATCPVFDKYILTLCSGNKEKSPFLLSWLYAFIFQCFDFNVSLLLYGKDFKGIQTFALLCAVLKQAAGSSSSEGARLDTHAGLPMVFDRSFECESNQQEAFFSFSAGKYSGPLLSELPGIFNAIFEVGSTKAFHYLIYTDLGPIVATSNPTTSSLQTPVAVLTDSMYCWVRDDVVIGKGAFLGHSNRTDLLNQRAPCVIDTMKMKKADLLYPAYTFWCAKVAKKPVPFQTFNMLLLGVLADCGFVAKKVRKTDGFFICGIGLRSSLKNNEQATMSLVQDQYNKEAPILNNQDQYKLAHKEDQHNKELSLINKELSIINKGSSLINNQDQYNKDAPILNNQDQYKLAHKEDQYNKDTSLINNQDQYNKDTSLINNQDQYNKDAPILNNEDQYNKDAPILNNEDQRKLAHKEDQYNKDTSLINKIFFKENSSIKQANLYNEYISLLGETPLKKRLNAFTIKENNITENDYSIIATLLRLDTFFNLPCVSEKVHSLIQREFSLLKSQGIVACKYQTVPRSRHVIPSGLSPTITTVKTLVRYHGFSAMENMLKERNTSIVFLKLGGSLLSILCGLFPLPLKPVINKIPKAYSESIVMACAQSAFVGGNEKDLQNSVLDLCCTELSLKKSVLKKDNNLKELHELCSKIARDVGSSDLIASLRALSARIIENDQKKTLFGPTGLSFELMGDTLKENFPLFLEDLQFCLIAQSLIETKESFSKLEVLGHYRDTVALAIPSGQCSAMESLFRERVTYLINSFGLDYNPIIEVKYKI